MYAFFSKIFADEELAQMIDPILETDDRNKGKKTGVISRDILYEPLTNRYPKNKLIELSLLDGFIDYVEFLAAQKARGF